MLFEVSFSLVMSRNTPFEKERIYTLCVPEGCEISINGVKRSEN